MGFFPVFTDLAGRKVLICGSGSAALEKIRKLQPFGPDITVISREIPKKAEETEYLHWIRRGFEPGDLAGRPAFVIAAENREENSRICSLCRKAGIPVNAADQPEECDFYFPALVQAGDLTVGISTAGKAPAAAAALRQELEEQLPDDTEEIISWLEALRQQVRRKTEDSGLRRSFLRKAAQAAFAKGRPLDVEELRKLK